MCNTDMMRGLAIFISILSVGFGQKVGWGPCPKVEVEGKFKITKYMGTWYELETIPNLFQRGSLSCTEAEYKLLPNNHVHVHNSALNKDGKLTEIIGELYTPNSDEPAKLIFEFSKYLPSVPYWVIDTDNMGYTFVFACNQLPFGIAHAEFAWLLARNRTTDPSVYKPVLDKAATYGIAVDSMDITSQNNCPN